MEKLKRLRVATRALIIVTIIIFLVSAYNCVTFFSGMISQDAGIGLKLNQIPGTSDYVLSLSVNPSNRGFLGVDLSARLMIFDDQGKMSDSNSTFVNIPPGPNRSSYVSIEIPKSMIPDGNIQNVKGSVQIELDVRTFWNLVGFKNVIRAGSGQ